MANGNNANRMLKGGERVLTEKDVWYMNGILALVVEIMLLALFLLNILHKEYVFAVIFISLFCVILTGFTSNRSYEAKRVLFFGKYVGTLRNQGLAVTIPFTKRETVSLQPQLLESVVTVTPNLLQTMQVKLVLFYRIVDTAKAMFSNAYLEKLLRLKAESLVQTFAAKEQWLPQLDPEKHTKFLQLINENIKIYGIEVTEAYFYVQKQGNSK